MSSRKYKHFSVSKFVSYCAIETKTANRIYYGRVQRKVSNTENYDDEGTELRSVVTVDYLHGKRSFRCNRSRSMIHSRELNSSRCRANPAFFQVSKSIDRHFRVTARINEIAIATSKN